MNTFKTPIMIGIGGISCSGKTELTKSICETMGHLNPTVISLDSYYKDLSHIGLTERKKHNFDHPSALDYNLLITHIRKLRNFKSINKPIYDFSTHTRLSKKEEVKKGQLIIVEGIFALLDKTLWDMYDLKVYIELDNETALSRRIHRDTESRQRSKQSIREQYLNFVLPMQEEFILPTREIADLVVSGSDPVLQSGDKVIQFLNRILTK